ncbi:MAG: hypothetical protein P8N72_13995 [Flavimaricola sp.]|nr:hypothetical protein [Flavimaricola sp.]
MPKKPEALSFTVIRRPDRVKGLLATAALVAFLLPASVQAQASLVLDPGGMRALAAESLRASNWSDARRLSGALLQRDPEDLVALTILAQSSFQLGDMDTAYEAAASIYRSDAPDSERYQAARLAALASANQDRFTLGEIWLRRALTVAPSAEDAAQTLTDAAGLRRVNPWSTSVSLSFAPSNNVNGGAESNINVIDGVPIVGILSESAQALSGWLGETDIRTTYRFRESNEYRTFLSARFAARGVILSQESKDRLEADNARGFNQISASDFSTRRLEFSIGHDQAARRGVFGLDLYGGGYWSGTDYSYSYLRASGDRTVAVTQQVAVKGSAFYEQRFDPDSNARADTVFGGQAEVISRLQNGGQLSATIAYSARESDLLNNVSDTWTAHVGYAHGDLVGPAQLSGYAGVQLSDFPDYAVGFIRVPGGRQDQRIFAALEAAFPNYSYAGFAPVLSLNLGQTESNVSRFNLDDIGIKFGIRSTF